MIVLQFVSRLPGGPTVGLLVTPQVDLGHRPHLPGLLPLEPLSLQQAAAQPLDQCLLSCAINAYLAEKQPLHCRVIIVCRPLDQRLSDA